ncbi:hypothetical protein ABID21_004906 [Pseudorhizobium tarimense]|uniref:Uncharacterized protein n=1 Tax=Pseudorhizobium tarimense TaxID=1079109 RepID=A0ABV2HED4_9HYPH
MLEPYRFKSRPDAPGNGTTTQNNIKMLFFSFGEHLVLSYGWPCHRYDFEHRQAGNGTTI